MKQTNILDIYNTLQILAVLIHIVVITECGTKEKILMVMKPETNVPAYNYFTNSIFSWYKEPYAHLWSTEHFINANITGFRSPLLNSWNELKVTKISCLLMNDYNDTLVSIHFDGTGKTLEDWYSNPTSEDFNNTQFNMTGLYAFDFLITHVSDTRLIKGGALFGGHSGVSTRQNKILFVLGDELLQLPIYGSKCIVGILPKAKFSYPVEKGEDCLYQCYRVGTNSAIVTTDISNMYPYHKCLCFNNPPSLPMANGCGVPCYGDGSKKCGDKTKDIYVQYNTSIISEYFEDTEEELTIVNEHIPAYTAVTTMMDSFTTMIKADMCALLSGMTILPNGGSAPAITMRISKSNCTDLKKFNSENGTTAVFDNFNELYEFDNLMVRCIVLNNTGNLPVDVMLHFRSSTVIIASMLAVVAEIENDQCQLVDITLAEEFLDMSQIDTWYGENGTNVSGITNAGLRLGYRDFAPPPEIIMKVSKNPYGKTAWMKEIHLETNSEHVVMFMDGNCSGNYIIWLVEHQGQALTSGNYLHSIVTTSAETFCLEKIHLTLYQPNNDHYFLKAEMYGCLSYGKPANCSDTVDFFQNGIIPLGNVMVHSSHSMPNAIFPCMPALNIDRMNNNLPLKITLIVPKDDRVDSLPVKSIAVEGHEVSSINISSMSSRDDSDFGLISAAFYRYTTNTVSVLFTPNKQIFAFRITHHTTSDHYEITFINVTTCVYNEQILRKINVSYNGSCEETTTESVTTTTTSPETTTTLSETTTTSPETTTTSPETSTTSPETTTTSPETTTTPPETTTTSPETTTTSPETTTNPETTTTLTTAQTTMASQRTTTSPDPMSLPETTTASSEHNTTPEMTTVASANNQCCICIPIPETITTQEAEKKAEELKKDLIVDKSTLSSTKRKKTSANDDRPSAKMVGSLGVILLTVAIGLVVAMDANYIIKAFKKISAWRKFKRLKNQTSELE